MIDKNGHDWAKPQTPPLEWRRGKISHELWKSGYWQYGLQDTEPMDGYVRYHGPEEWNPSFTDDLDWWAPTDQDGMPRPWPVASPVAPQPAPQPGTVDVWPLVIEDMQRRDAEGRRQYGTPLQAHNGRDALLDAYQEALDLAVYLRQEIVQREDAAAEIDALRAENDRLRFNIACMAALADLDASESELSRESEVHTAHALVYLRVARAVPADREYWLRLARESRDHAREARKEERLPAF